MRHDFYGKLGLPVVSQFLSCLVAAHCHIISWWTLEAPQEIIFLWGASKNMGGHFSEKKGACGNVPTSLGLPKIWGPFFWKKKAPAATYPQIQGFQKNGCHFSEEKKAPAATYPQIKGFQIYGGHFPTPLTPKRHGSTTFHKNVKKLLELAKHFHDLGTKKIMSYYMMLRYFSKSA